MTLRWRDFVYVRFFGFGRTAAGAALRAVAVGAARCMSNVRNVVVLTGTAKVSLNLDRVVG